MASVNDANFANKKLDEVNKRGFPNIGDLFSTTGKKITSFYMAVMAGMIVIAALTNLARELPRRENPRFTGGEGSRK